MNSTSILQSRLTVTDWQSSWQLTPYNPDHENSQSMAPRPAVEDRAQLPEISGALSKSKEGVRTGRPSQASTLSPFSSLDVKNTVLAHARSRATVVRQRGMLWKSRTTLFC